MQVLKFGGSSVASAENINKVIDIVLQKIKEEKTVLVVSALGGVTDLLLNSAAAAASADEHYVTLLQDIEDRHLQATKQLINVNNQSSVLSNVKKMCNDIFDICKGIFLIGELSAKTKDKVVSYGELLSSYIIAEKLKEQQADVEWQDSRKFIITDSNYGNAAVNFELTNKNLQFLTASNASLHVFPGFVSSAESGSATTLGRGGSDYTAAIIAGAIQASKLEIWTDVSGMMTADPRIVSNYKLIPSISYQEAMELSHFGAKVIYPPTIQPVMKKNIPVWVKNTFAPQDEGTEIKNELMSADAAIRGISSINKVALLTLEGSGMVGIPGFSKRLFEALANKKINVILITQSSSEHSICVAVDAMNAEAARVAVDGAFEYEIKTAKVEPLVVEEDLAVVAVVGDGMKSQTGVAGRMFSALGKNGINIRAIAQGSSEKNISAVINALDVVKAVNVLHEAFFETTYKQINLFIAGVGNVGQRLLAQLQQQREFLQSHLRLHVKVVGLANSTKVCYNENGIELLQAKEFLQNAAAKSINEYVDLILHENLRNSIFVDVTAHDQVATVYGRLLEKSVSVVACNKVAASSEYKYYKQLKEVAKHHNAKFLFETNVGAGLPIIGTLNDIINSGDEVLRIKAVLSGTLNFVFNHYDGTLPFADVVRKAQEEGYTEPDPRLDLGGKDVMRKIMILARESGHAIEMDDISNTVFMPERCMLGGVEDFYKSMAEEEAHFKALYNKAAAANCKLKFVATFEDGKAKVSLEHINPEHDFYHLYGKDNIVLFYTHRYNTLPMVVKGAGAGAEVTASGVFADIIRATN